MTATETEDWRRRAGAGADWLGRAFERRVRIDLRALAAFRIAIGGLIVLDLLLRARDFTAFYTDDGVLPTSALYSDYSEVNSLHAYLGDAWLVGLLFVIAATFGVLLMLGYRTRTVTFVSWLLLFSLHNRNPMILNGGDVLFRMLLFWSVFLPLGARWSIDARRRDDVVDTDASAIATRTSAAVLTVMLACWALLSALYDSNPMSLFGGDVLFRVLLFLSIFVPLGAAWSIQAGGREDAPASRGTGVATIASAAILAQVAIMYVSNFVHKTRGDEWLNGEAVAYIMTLDQFTVLLGPYLAEFPELLVFFTYFWLFLMAMSPFLFLLTGWPRALLATGFMGMHLGMAATMQIGVFPLVAVAGLLLFYQSEVWDAAEAIADRRGLTDRVHAVSPRVDSALPSRSTDGLPHVPYLTEIRPVRPILTTVIPSIFLVLILVSNAHVLGYADAPPESGDSLLEKTDTDQSWRLFAPNPLKDTRWFVANATLENGEQVDAFTGEEVTFDRPPDPADRAGNARWRKYLSNVYGTSNENHRSYLANYLCDRWNRSHDATMESVEIYVLRQQGTPFGAEADVRERKLITYDCSGSFIQS